MNNRPYTLVLFLGCILSLSLGRELQAQFRPLLITLDHNDDFVITGDGQRIKGVSFVGPGPGTFEIPAGTGQPFVDPDSGKSTTSAPAPFQVTLASGTKSIAFGMLGDSVIIDGSYPLQFGPTDLALLDSVEVEVGIGPTPFANPLGLVCDDCIFPDVQRTASGGIVVTNVNEPIINLTVFSKDGGITVTSLPAGVSVVESLPNRVTLENANGFTPESLQSLDFLSGISSDQPVFAKFTLADSSSFGPFRIASVPEPATRSSLLIATLIGWLALRPRRKKVGEW